MPVFGHREDKSKAEVWGKSDIGIKLVTVDIIPTTNIAPGSFHDVTYTSANGAYNNYKVIGVTELCGFTALSGGRWGDNPNMQMPFFNANIDANGQLTIKTYIFNTSSTSTITPSTNKFSVRLALVKSNIIES